MSCTNLLCIHYVATERTDYSFTQASMHVIWARGQEYGQEIHVPDSGLERNEFMTENFYRRDELKYHGHRTQRGVTTRRFLGEKMQTVLFTNNTPFKDLEL